MLAWPGAVLLGVAGTHFHRKSALIRPCGPVGVGLISWCLMGLRVETQYPFRGPMLFRMPCLDMNQSESTVILSDCVGQSFAYTCCCPLVTTWLAASVNRTVGRNSNSAASSSIGRYRF